MPSIELLCTDFDGTLVHHPGLIQCPDSLAENLKEVQRSGGAWVINTGRTLDHMIEGLEKFQAPVQPNFLIVNERHIYLRQTGKWKSHESWNTNCDRHHDLLLADHRAIFEAIRRFAAGHREVELVLENSLPVGLITTNEETMVEVADYLDSFRTTAPVFSYQRNSIYLRFSHQAYSKGTALAELAGLTGVSRERILAAGDNHNDLSMLDGVHAGLVACPSNSVPEVKAAVADAGGYLAEAEGGHGTSEAIDFFLQETGPAHSNEHLCAGTQQEAG